MSRSGVREVPERGYSKNTLTGQYFFFDKLMSLHDMDTRKSAL